MKKFFLRILLIALLMYFGCQQKQVENKSDIQCILTLDRTTFKIDEIVPVNVIIKNNSSKEIVITEWPSRETMYFTYDVEGERNASTDRADFEKPTKKESYIILSPKEEMFWGATEFGKEYFNEIGKWDLKIVREYNFTGEDFGISAWTGLLNSNTVTLQIVE